MDIMGGLRTFAAAAKASCFTLLKGLRPAGEKEKRGRLFFRLEDFTIAEHFDCNEVANCALRLYLSSYLINLGL
jgi:hypothetical protein